MKAVILAAGKGTRMQPLGPKPLLPVAGKPVLERNMEQLDGLVDGAVVVVGHQSGKVKSFLQGKSFSFPLTVAEQPEQRGTLDALLQARPHLQGRFLVMNGDDLYSREDIQACLKHDRSILVNEMENTENFGVVEADNSILKKIIEKPASPASGLVSTGLYVLDPDIFSRHQQESPRGELELTDAVNALAQEKPIAVVPATNWLPIGYPWDLLEANEALLKKLESANEGTVEEYAVLKGAVSIGKGTMVKSGSCIEGPVVIGRDCVIGPNCYIRGPTSIGDGCKVGNAVEVKNSILGDRVSIGHLSYVGDSVLGSSINLGAGCIAANLRHDGKSVSATVRGGQVDTGRRKFGCVIASGVCTGIHTSIYPGRSLASNTLPGEVVKESK